MKDDLIADLWHVVVEHIPEKHRQAVANDFINILLDHGIKESVLEDLLGIDSHLDEAIEYSIDGEDIEEDEWEDED